ncbi:hypothetical protein AALP_AA8G212800 [Arabis alpina]|uniref:Uncharacterized protein n=1 Tax=Arabis alpina TaxID=50452 RepID=A0A087G8H4_ARAAL|nr:hypothetical protein AALP_AA8G212800 [Arabis alpina]
MEGLENTSNQLRSKLVFRDADQQRLGLDGGSKSSPSSEAIIPNIPVKKTHQKVHSAPPQQPLNSRLGAKKEPRRAVTLHQQNQKKGLVKGTCKKRGGNSPVVGASSRKRNALRSVPAAKKKLNIEAHKSSKLTIYVPFHEDNSGRVSVPKASMPTTCKGSMVFQKPFNFQ